MYGNVMMREIVKLIIFSLTNLIIAHITWHWCHMYLHIYVVIETLFKYS